MNAITGNLPLAGGWCLYRPSGLFQELQLIQSLLVLGVVELTIPEVVLYVLVVDAPVLGRLAAGCSPRNRSEKLDTSFGHLWLRMEEGMRQQLLYQPLACGGLQNPLLLPLHQTSRW